MEMLMYSYSGITNFFIDDKCTLNDPKNIEFMEKFLGGYGKTTSEDDINKGWTEMAAQYHSNRIKENILQCIAVTIGSSGGYFHVWILSYRSKPP